MTSFGINISGATNRHVETFYKKSGVEGYMTAISDLTVTGTFNVTCTWSRSMGHCTDRLVPLAELSGHGITGSLPDIDLVAGDSVGFNIDDIQGTDVVDSIFIIAEEWAVP